MIIASVAGFVIFIAPRYTSVQDLRAEQKEYDTALANARELQAKREELLAKFNEFDTSDVEDLEKLLPDNIDNVKLIIELDSLASQYGMALQDVSVLDNEPTGEDILIEENLPYGTVGIEFSVTGPYNRFVDFIKNVETSLRLIDVKEITFQTSTLTSNYQYNVEVQTYWLK